MLGHVCLPKNMNMKKKIKAYKINHPIAFASGLFKGSRLNWADLTKQAFAIYSSIEKLYYYLEDADIVLRNTLADAVSRLGAYLH